jgi:amino acid permease
MLYFGAHGVVAKRWFSITVAFAIAGPLACFPKLSALRYTSIGVILIVVWTVIFIALNFAGVLAPCEQSVMDLSVDGLGALETSVASLATAASEGHIDHVADLPCSGASFVPVGAEPLKILKAFPVFIFCFTCHQNVFTICNEVRNASKRRVDGMVVAAYTVSATAFLLTALMGYRIYGADVQSDVLKGFPDTAIGQVTRILYVILVICSYPLLFHPARVSLLALWQMAFPVSEGNLERSEHFRYWLLTLVVLTSSFTVALSVDDLGVMLGIVGATGSTAVSYILPGLLYWNLFKTRHIKRMFALAQLLIGCIIMPVCLVALFI